MKCTIPEIAWHNKDPVLSVDINPSGKEFFRLASGGTDCHVLIWHLIENESVNLEIVADLTRHQRAVNVVRWSPTGNYLASGDDDANIIIWKLKVDNVPLLEENIDKEQWIVHKVLRGHKDDIYDICWAPDESKLVSGSIDNTAIIWDFTKGKMNHILTDHKGFVQGVSWDPKGDYIATLSSDRTCRIFDQHGKQVIKRIKKGYLPLSSSHSLFEKEVKYFHDDTFKSYFRRLSFSPDGNLLITPSGCVETDECKKALHATYIFTLQESQQPVAVLPTSKQNTIAVRCCPILFELRNEGPQPLVQLPYRMIIAVATDSDVILYDTQQQAPFAHLQKIHYTRLTDLTWSPNGLILACSSTDGFCTFVTFSPNELGVQYKESDDEKENTSNIKNVSDTNASIEKVSETDHKPKKPSLLEQWTVKSPRTNTNAISKLGDNKVRNVCDTEVVDITDSPEKTDDKTKLISIPKSGKRIVPIKIGDSSQKSTMKVKPSESKEIHKGSPIQRNSILNFLNSNEETPRKKKRIDKSQVSVDETEEARDSWKCAENVVEIIDEESEFKLEISQPLTTDSNSACPTAMTDNETKSNILIGKAEDKISVDSKLDAPIKSKKVAQCGKSNEATATGNTHSSDDKPKGRRVDFITLSNQIQDNKNGNVNNKSNNGSSVNADISKSQESQVADGQTDSCSVSVVPKEKLKGRRVPLITISSPKTKCKKDDVN